MTAVGARRRAAPGREAAGARVVDPPDGLLAPWRSLPTLALVLAQAFAPPGAPRWVRAVFTPFWLLETVVQRAAGRLLACGPATLTIWQPQPQPVLRRVLQTAVSLLAGVLAVVAVMTPPAVVGAAVGAAPDGVGWMAGARGGLVLGAALLMWQLAPLIRGARYGVRLRRVVKPLRRGGPWGEVASLAGGRDGQATRDLVRAVLRWADENGVGLAAVPSSERLRRVYGRAGFRAASPGSCVLLREPRSPG